ncbi:hypothetical protein B0P06_004669 [Clostridium saccharoperbutylacetonicum]|uniref:Uncharacterized protein n=1 Tax=Clostridium saccharoperbutylacetonicum N1-4(HMT) TaxID=931276 RepID=M1MLB1_9CLOT|nr:hypothetical protein Cspa_c32820 [Clostridium saccharoperbutylacetonicum N1-4(HMT)]NRT62197.1 hypothetical protein [Clostridium saccharoperbutylacetonicum]NSB25528.1 hypothetical protein [Clostridium saccharoperbutylacetonicum]NSB44898.1 hypothetical protein [Clostridium saccharoperbutylacetonicum]
MNFNIEQLEEQKIKILLYSNVWMSVSRRKEELKCVINRQFKRYI